MGAAGRVKLVEYAIRSGNVVEKRRCRMRMHWTWEAPARRGKKACKSSAAKIRGNEQESVKKLARMINCNFGAGDLWLTLRWADCPEDWDEAYRRIKYFFDRARERMKKETGKALRYIWSPGKKSTKTGEDARPHIHVVMDRLGWETVCALWPEGDVTYRIIDSRGDYTGIARYMVSNAGYSTERGRRAWNTSRGLKKPVYTEPVPVADVESMRAPKGAEITERVILQDEVTGLESGYMRYIVPERAQKHGGHKKDRDGGTADGI